MPGSEDALAQVFLLLQALGCQGLPRGNVWAL